MHGVELIDIQMTTSHMKSMGSEEISLEEFLEIVSKLIKKPTNPALLEKKNLSATTQNS